MDIVVSGSTGLVGSALCRHLMDAGHQVRRLVRPNSLTNPNKAPLGTTIQWDPDAGTIDAAQLEGCDAVINLAGESIVGYWSINKKYRILDSRVDGTALLANTLPKLITPPKLLLNASATGFYGNRKDETLDEDSQSGGGFLAEVCRRWEAAAKPAADTGIRVAFLRLGMVLSPLGGALKSMLPAYKLGFGGPVGHGRQYWPWISINDTVGAIAYLAERDDTRGAYNLVAPQTVTSDQFAQALGKVLHRPTVCRVPETWLTLLADGLADELLLSSQRAVPRRLTEAGFAFEHADLADALRALAA